MSRISLLKNCERVSRVGAVEYAAFSQRFFFIYPTDISQFQRFKIGRSTFPNHILLMLMGSVGYLSDRALPKF